MDLFAASLPFLKVIAAFALMLAGIRNKLGLSLSILLGGLFMGLIFGLSVAGCVHASVFALVQEKFLYLVVIVGTILILSDALEKSGQSARLMDALSGYLVNPRLRTIFFPALIGLLPMPGFIVSLRKRSWNPEASATACNSSDTPRAAMAPPGRGHIGSAGAGDADRLPRSPRPG